MYKRQALEEVERQIRQGKDSSFRDGFEFTEARLVGSFPRSRIVVLFRWDRYPDLLCGRSVRIWDSENLEYEYHEVHDFLMNIVLGLQNRRVDLPDPTPDRRHGIAWI